MAKANGKMNPVLVLMSCILSLHSTDLGLYKK